MELVLILSSIVMYFLTKRYNTKDWCKNFYFDVFVQILHIVTLCVICIELSYFSSISLKICLAFSVYILLKNIFYLIDNIVYELFLISIEDDDDECDNSKGER